MLNRHWWIVGLALAVIVALFSPLATSQPDGLERVAEDQGFIDRAQGAPYEIIADYLFPGIENEAIATVLAGIVGTGIMFGLVYGVAWLLRRRTGQIAS
jgi:hypothetical protein